MTNPHTALPLAPRAKRHRMIHPWLPAEAWRALELEAGRRSLHPDVFAALLLEIIARDNLFNAIIDDAAAQER